jgi:flagellar FliJ protein
MFRFKLEFLLRYRRQKEETAMMELARRVRMANEIENEIQDIEERKEQLAASVSSMTGTCVPGPVFLMYADCRQALTRSGREAARKLTRAEAQIEQQRQNLVKCSVDRKVIDKYKERLKQHHLKEEGLKEQKNLDELAALARSRRDYGSEE